jgi:hypothetical protein
MKVNVGTTNRWWGLLGLLPLGTGLLGWCAVYTLLGIDTRGREDRGPGAPRPAA